METIGNRLRTARESRDLSIEDAAHRTRIQAIYIRGLENDDYSNFPSTTYAKSFLTLYSRFLEVDADDALELFAGGDAISLSGQGYLESVTDNIEPRRPTSPYASRSARPSAVRRSQATSPGLAPLFLGVILLALVIAIPTFWILGKDSDSMDEVVSKAEDLTNTTFTTTDPQAEKIEPNPTEESVDETSKSGSPSPPAAPVAEPKPVSEPASIPETPRETRVAQVVPPNSADRNLKTQPGGATSSVINQEKPKKPAAVPIRATPKPVANEAALATGAAGPEKPLRAVPLIARPVIDPEAAAGDPEDVETGEVEAIPDPEASGNRYPRPPE